LEITRQLERFIRSLSRATKPGRIPALWAKPTTAWDSSWKNT